MTIMSENMATGRQDGSVVIAKSLHLIQKLQAERVREGLVWAFKTSKPKPSDTPL